MIKNISSKFHKYYSIYCNPKYGPTFGGGHDIGIIGNPIGNLSKGSRLYTEQESYDYNGNTDSNYEMPKNIIVMKINKYDSLLKNNVKTEEKSHPLKFYDQDINSNKSNGYVRYTKSGDYRPMSTDYHTTEEFKINQEDLKLDNKINFPNDMEGEINKVYISTTNSIRFNNDF